MGSIDIIAIPYDSTLGKGDYSGLAKQIRLSPDVFGRLTIASLQDPGLLLAEAIHFYNYGIDGNKLRLPINKIAWKPFDENTVPEALEQLCKHIITHTYKMATLLVSGKLQNQLKESVYQSFRPSNNSAICGLLAAHVLLAGDFRNQDKVGLLWSSRGRSGVNFRPFELLESVLENLERYFYLETIQEGIAKEFNPSLDCLFQPTWGGSRIIQPLVSSQHGRYQSAWDPSQPFCPHENLEVGPTEKLYFSVASSIFNQSHGQVLGSRSYCNLLNQVKDKALIIERILPSEKLPEIWQAWINNLNRLESLFGEAALQHAISFVQFEIAGGYDVTERYVKSGTQVGLPCAFGLIAVLRAYIAFLIGYALRVSLPLAIYKIYNDVNGYLGGALWEALNGQDMIGVNYTGCLTQWGLVGQLSSWRKYPFRDLWGNGVEINTKVKNILQRKFDEPMATVKYKVKIKTDEKEWKEERSLKINPWDFKKSRPRFPVLRKELGIARTYLPNTPGPEYSDWLYGATFSAQAHLFVVNQILSKAAGFLRWKKSDNPVLKITAGSYLWDGKKPPHITHREGINFDLDFKPNFISWPKLKYNQALIDYVKGLDSEEKINLLSKAIGCSEEDIRNPVILCYTTQDNEQAKNGRMAGKKVVFVPLVQWRVDHCVKILNEHLQETIDLDDSLSKESEESAFAQEVLKYQEIETEIGGTPHYVADDPQNCFVDYQRAFATHLAILLSAPSAIVFASPIHHFRCVRILRQCFRPTEIPLKTICLDNQVVSILDQGIIPDQLKVALQENLPISDIISASVLKTSSAWQLINEHHELLLIKKNSEFTLKTFIPLKLCQLVALAIKSVYFQFEPSNHYHHWHVNYHRGGSKAVNRFSIFMLIWLELGVDITILNNYLHKYTILDEKNELLKEIVTERENLKELCLQFKIQFEQKYGTEIDDSLDRLKDYQKRNRTITTKLIERLFGELRKEGGLLTPAIGKGYKAKQYPDELPLFWQDCEATTEVLKKALPAMKKKNRITDDDLRAFEEDVLNEQVDDEEVEEIIDGYFD